MPQVANEEPDAAEVATERALYRNNGFVLLKGLSSPPWSSRAEPKQLVRPRLSHWVDAQGPYAAHAFDGANIEARRQG